MHNRPCLITTIFVASLALCATQFVDDINAYEEECLSEDTFHCQDGECIHQDLYCNGKPDCRDGSDEHFCPGVKVDVQECNETHAYPCRDRTKCIPFSWICNNNTDCEDGDDEENCTVIPLSNDSQCKGFKCGDGKCISRLWVCDGTVDCADRSDEYNETLCRTAKGFERYLEYDGHNCEHLDSLSRRQYQCVDQSYCLQGRRMCDGIQDCRDGSDEGPFCANWTTMCSAFACGAGATCRPDRVGPTCECAGLTQYWSHNRSCVDVDECEVPQPHCSHKCSNKLGRFTCECDEGYVKDRFEYLCFANGTEEPLLFFSTHNEIRYYMLKSRREVVLVTDVKKAHGIAFDGTFVYWAETAQGHQAIVKARKGNIENSKQTLVSFGLEDPGDIAIDWLAGHVYFSDAERGRIAACTRDGAICVIVNTTARHPRFVTLNPEVGEMFWADWHGKPVIIRAKMDGSHPSTFVDDLQSFPTGLALDIPNERLYYVDRHIRVVRLDGKGRYSLLEDAANHPYSLVVFENTVYWSDWASNTLQAADKLYTTTRKRRVVLALDKPVFGIHMYHPLLQRRVPHGCERHNCSDFCLLNGNGTHSCACPEGRRLVDNTTCGPASFRELPQFLVVGGGPVFTRLRYNALGNVASRAVFFNIGRVQAMAYNSFKRILYIYDGRYKAITYIHMNDFPVGISKLLEYRGLANVVDMDYDYVSDALYFADAGRGFIEVISLRTSSRAIIYRFRDGEVPVSICVIPEYGKLMVAVLEFEQSNEIHIDSMGLDGEGRTHLVTTGFKGPRIRLRYSREMDNVYISDEGNGIIEYIHPTGSGRENYRVLSTTVSSLAVSDDTVFWTDRKTPRLFWSGLHETGNKIRRLDLGIYPNDTQIYLQSTFPPPDLGSPLLQHPCFKQPPCSHICLQTSHLSPLQAAAAPDHIPTQFSMGYRCLCPAGLRLRGDTCEHLAKCAPEELYCHWDNACVNGQRCDGTKDCVRGEDEEGCDVSTESSKCSKDQKLCNGKCIDKHIECVKDTGELTPDSKGTCSEEEFKCDNSSICVQRWQLCDLSSDCPDGSDELLRHCDQLVCHPWEFTCTSRSCIMGDWYCDGDPDCPDASDEVDCPNKTCNAGFYQCKSGECIEMTRRCDAQQDCTDFSDEDDCGEDVTSVMIPDEIQCGENEYTCQLNRSICLPLSARCNTKVECPGGTDESDCEYICSVSAGLFRCEQEDYCISRRFLCDGTNNCRDGSDEAPWNCAHTPKPNRGSTLAYPSAECKHGFGCGTGQCIEWDEVCDQTPHCFDGSDENGACFTSCDNHTCDFTCQPTPQKGVCLCPAGYQLDRRTNKCLDIDECAADLCSQKCHNVPGSFFCSCFHGYALRSNRRTCKAIKGHLQVLYVSGNAVRSIAADGQVTSVFSDPNIARIDDMDYIVRQNKLYLVSEELRQLVEVNGTNDNVVVTNVGRPSMVAVDWITGNAYFVDATPNAQRIRVCDVPKRRCAVLQRLPSDTAVTAFIVDPPNHRMFYCLTHSLESVVWSASLSGHETKDLVTVENCTGLAVDSFKQQLYVAEMGPAKIWRLDYDGLTSHRLYQADPHLQAPHHLAIFEDHLYFLVANSFKLSRCSLHPPQTCEPYIYRMFDANTFVLKHESVQRDDVTNACADSDCSDVCVLARGGALCVCGDGALRGEGGRCQQLAGEELTLFNGYTAAQLQHGSSHWLLAMLCISVGLLVAAVAGYQLMYKRRLRWRRDTHVRFENVTTPPLEGASASTASDQEPRVQLPVNDGGAIEFVNPLQHLRRMFARLSFRRWSFRRGSRPVGTSGLTIDLPSPRQRSESEDLSDTESDLDTKALVPSKTEASSSGNQ